MAAVASRQHSGCTLAPCRCECEEWALWMWSKRGCCSENLHSAKKAKTFLLIMNEFIDPPLPENVFTGTSVSHLASAWLEEMCFPSVLPGLFSNMRIKYTPAGYIWYNTNLIANHCQICKCVCCCRASFQADLISCHCSVATWNR